MVKLEGAYEFVVATAGAASTHDAEEVLSYFGRIVQMAFAHLLFGVFSSAQETLAVFHLSIASHEVGHGQDS